MLRHIGEWLPMRTMKTILNRIRRFFGPEGGPTVVEYAVFFALIVVVCLTVIRLAGAN
jgi:Flp pilus assembly pilin Flp